MFDQALEGGGAKNINFQELAADLAQITFDYPVRLPLASCTGIREASINGLARLRPMQFLIPPYFALIIRKPC